MCHQVSRETRETQLVLLQKSYKYLCQISEWSMEETKVENLTSRLTVSLVSNVSTFIFLVRCSGPLAAHRKLDSMPDSWCFIQAPKWEDLWGARGELSKREGGC